VQTAPAILSDAATVAARIEGIKLLVTDADVLGSFCIANHVRTGDRGIYGADSLADPSLVLRNCA
jgi:hypothetical protein